MSEPPTREEMLAPKQYRFPRLSLPDAIQIVGNIYIDKNLNNDRLTDQTIAAAAGHKVVSGPSRTKQAALKKYGLIVKGVEGDREWRISNRAIHILELSNDDPEQAKALRDAFFGVNIYAEMDEAVSQGTYQEIRSHLITKENWPVDKATKAAEVFITSKEHAFQYKDQATPEPDQIPVHEDTDDRETISFDVSEGCRITLQVPAVLPVGAKDLIQSWLNYHLDRLSPKPNKRDSIDDVLKNIDTAGARYQKKRRETIAFQKRRKELNTAYQKKRKDLTGSTEFPPVPVADNDNGKIPPRPQKSQASPERPRKTKRTT